MKTRRTKVSITSQKDLSPRGIKPFNRHENFSHDIAKMIHSKDLTIRVRAVDLLEDMQALDERFASLAMEYNERSF